MSRIIAAIVSVAALTASTGHAQSPNPVTIRGRVLAADTGDPLPHARVVAFNDATPLSPVFTDRDGRFAFTSLPAGRYHLSVTKAGYVITSVARLNEAPADGVDVRMPRSSAISGRVVDALGEPSVGVRISVNLRNDSKGLVVVKATQTDDLGEYRLGGLAEGSYVVSVNVMQMDAQGNLTLGATYFPDVATLADAETITLRAGDQRAGVDFVGIPSQPTSNTVATQIVRNPQGNVTTFRLVSPTPQAGAAPAGTGTIRGRVTRSDGVPLPRTTVTTTATAVETNNAGFYARAVSTDDDGRFEFSELPRGSYRISASKLGYTGAVYGQRTASDRGESINLADGESRSRADIVLPRYGSVTGRIVDDYGDPVEGLAVRVGQIRFQAGRRRLVGVDGTVGQTTDDLGRYRIYGLQPGQYILSALAGQVTPFQQTPDLLGYATTYFPGTPNPAEAQMVAVGLSQDLVGVDLALAQVPTARITGHAFNADGEPVQSSLALVPSQRSGAVLTDPVGARTYPDGRFEFPSVAPGQYAVQLYRGRSNASAEGAFASQPVTVNGADVVDLELRASVGSSLRGRLTLDGDGTPRAAPVELSPIPVDVDRAPQGGGSIARGGVHPDWTFEFTGLHGPRRLALVRAPAGWALKAVVVNGIDVTDMPLPFGLKDQSLNDVEVALTARVTEITGAVLDARGRPVTDYALVVFPTDRELWYPESRFLKRSAPGRDGRFNVRGLPPGDYFVAPVDAAPSSNDADAWQDPEWLESIAPRAARVTLAEGQKLAVSPHLVAR